MAASTDVNSIPARGKVIERREGGRVVFAPANTNYELDLLAPDFQGALNVLTEGHVRVTARKIWTVPGGGNFISPLLGPPRTIQGRIRAAGDRSIVIQAGCPITVDFPAAESGLDLANGPLQVGATVNVMAMPGASIRIQNAE
jgi:hypothetical protein